MKIVFLDIDGVLTSLDCRMKLDQKNIDRLGKIIEATDAKLVITSSWRRHKLEDTIKELTTDSWRHAGAIFPYRDKIIGHTRRLYCFDLNDPDTHFLSVRGLEIENWLRIEGKDLNIESFVIIDDDSDMLLQHAPYFVKTDTYKGLSDKNVDKAIRILNSKT